MSHINYKPLLCALLCLKMVCVCAAFVCCLHMFEVHTVLKYIHGLEVPVSCHQWTVYLGAQIWSMSMNLGTILK